MVVQIKYLLLSDNSIYKLKNETKDLDIFINPFQKKKFENLIRKSVNKLKGKVTIFSISHKFSFIKNCDRVFVLEKGFIKEDLSYEEFLIKSKYYKKAEQYLNES